MPQQPRRRPKRLSRRMRKPVRVLRLRGKPLRKQMPRKQQEPSLTHREPLLKLTPAHRLLRKLLRMPQMLRLGQELRR